MKNFNLDAILEAMLKMSDRVSDLNFSVGRPPQVEVDGQLVPVRIGGRDARELICGLRAHGFDATSGASTLVAIDARASRAREAMENVVYLPAVHTLTPAAVSMLAERVNELARLGTVVVESSDALDREPERSGVSSSNRAA